VGRIIFVLFSRKRKRRRLFAARNKEDSTGKHARYLTVRYRFINVLRRLYYFERT